MTILGHHFFFNWIYGILGGSFNRQVVMYIVEKINDGRWSKGSDTEESFSWAIYLVF